MCAKAFQPHLRDYCPNKPILSDGQYICTICQETRDRSGAYTSIPNNYTCSECIKSHSSQRYARPEVQQRHKFLSIKKLYGLSQEDYERMEREQDGKCAICHEPPNGKHAKTDGLFVDHNHETQEVRQLLCHQCNHLVGNSRERIDLLLSAIDYLLRHSPVPTVS